MLKSLKMGSYIVGGLGGGSSTSTHRLPNASSKKVSLVSKNGPECVEENFSRSLGLMSSRSENVNESVKKPL